MPVLTGSVHADILTKPSRAGFAVIRLELIKPGAATCVYQAKACSPTHQPVQKCKDGLGINMTMKTFFLLHHIASCEKHSMEWRLRRVVPAATVTTHAKPHAQQFPRDLKVERAANAAALSASKFRRGAAMQSAATSMAGFLVNCSSAAV